MHQQQQKEGQERTISLQHIIMAIMGIMVEAMGEQEVEAIKIWQDQEEWEEEWKNTLMNRSEE